MNNSTNQNEIDLTEVSNSVKSGFRTLSHYIYQFIKFIKRNIFIFLALFIIGAVLGYFLDKTNKKYESKIIVMPNFNTVDFLYTKVDLLNSKIEQNEHAFLDSLNITTDKKIGKIEIEPIANLYQFLNEEEFYYNTFKTLSENSDAKKVMEDITTSKNFKNHLITIKSKELIDQKVLEKVVDFINTSDYYQLLRKDIYDNAVNQIRINDSTIVQIDAILNSIPNSVGAPTSIYSTEKSQLNDLIEQKIDLSKRNQELKVHLHNLEYVVTPLSYIPNLEDKTDLTSKMTLILPLLFIGIFIVIRLVKKVN